MDHICGIYYVQDTVNIFNPIRYYLPQASVNSHTTISRLFYKTVLTQVYTNSSTSTIKELRYTFPLYDGVSVGSYIIKFGDTTLTGVVKQKAEAKQTYDAALERGETASLLEALPAGIFGVTIGNLPAGMDVHVEIAYAGELKHDAGVDGLRYMLPTKIAPRYGSYPGQVLRSNVQAPTIGITVDVDMGKSAIRKMQSPSHPIAMTLGATSKDKPDAAFQPSKGSATLTSTTTGLGDDFVLQVVIDHIDRPSAVLEKHPHLDSRAIMATLVPRFNLPLISPEIVFVADQSGSMSGSKNQELVAALQVFLKSLPIGVRFNICAFGSNYKYLWAKSQAYNEENLKLAQQWVATFNASYGGTELFEPVKQAFQRRHEDLPLEIVLLTDGEIWQEEQLFQLINDKIREDKIDARVFALGIGSDVSHTLVEGVARAGNGFAQFITSNEQIDQKIVRSLKGCLYPHLKNYSLEVNFDDVEDKEDDFEIVEKVSNCLHIDDPPSYDNTKGEGAAGSMSFFDEKADKDPAMPRAGRYAHLPTISPPSVLQAPVSIPPLFPFTRSNIYLLLGSEAPRAKVVSLILRADGPSGPLELTVPIYSQLDTAATVHQLAARKAIQDLEEGRGWLHEATTPDGYTVKQKFSSRFEELVEREAARLGESFNVAGKWTSFVAVNKENQSNNERAPQINGADADVMAIPSVSFGQPFTQHREMRRSRMGAAPPSGMSGMMAMGSKSIQAPVMACCPPAPAPAPAQSVMRKSFSPKAAVGGLFGGAAPGTSLFRSNKPATQTGGALLGNSNSKKASMSSSSQMRAAPSFTVGFGASSTAMAASPPGMDVGSCDINEIVLDSAFRPATSMVQSDHGGNVLRSLIDMQSFDGSWVWTTQLASMISLKTSERNLDKQTATIIVLAYLGKHLGSQKETWEMIAEKAMAWLRSGSGLDIDKAIQDAKDSRLQ